MSSVITLNGGASPAPLTVAHFPLTRLLEEHREETARSSPTDDAVAGSRFGRLEIRSRSPQRPGAVRLDASVFVRLQKRGLGDRRRSAGAEIRALHKSPGDCIIAGGSTVAYVQNPTSRGPGGADACSPEEKARPDQARLLVSDLNPEVRTPTGLGTNYAGPQPPSIGPVAPLSRPGLCQGPRAGGPGA